MKKTVLIIAAMFVMNFAFSQANKELNFGLIGVSYDIPLATNFAIAPTAGTDFQLDWVTVGLKGDYYFDNLFGLPESFDLYAGANVGYAFWIGTGSEFANTGDLNLGLQVGGRWFWSDKWGLFLEFGGGHTVHATGALGLTMKF